MDKCNLCSLQLPKHPIIADEVKFCCTGCHLVYQILSTQNALKSFKDTPLFQQAAHFGIISNPSLLEEINSDKICTGEKKCLVFEIRNLWCSSCALVIQLLCNRVRGVLSTSVDYSTDLAIIEYDPKIISKDTIFDKIRKLGYTPADLEETHQKGNFDLNLRLGVACFAALNIMMLSYPIYESYFGIKISEYGLFLGWVSFALSLPIIFYSAKPLFFRFYQGIKAKIFGMETLVVIGVAAAFVLSLYQLLRGSDHIYFDSMSMIIVFVLWGKLMESKAKFSTKSALFALNRSFPKRGRKRFSDQTVQFVPVKEIQEGDVLITCTGEKIVMDGVVIEGCGSVDESFMTGEAHPLNKIVGSSVLAGSILKSGWIALKAASRVEGTFYHQIIDVLQNDLGKKGSEITLADRVSKLFVPIVLLVAIFSTMTMLFLENSLELAVVRGMAVLLIACPCAIGIAAPLVESLFIHKLVKMGAILRNRSIISYLGNEDLFVFDKTGTLTEGKFTVLSGLENLSQTDLWHLERLTSISSHSISCAITQALQGLITENCHIPLVHVEECIGKGVKGVTSEDVHYTLGSASFLKEQGIRCIELNVAANEERLTSIVYFARGGECLSAIVLGDKLREGIKPLLKILSNKEVVILSGDSVESVCSVAKACGIHTWYASQNPLQKRMIIEEYRKKGKIVCMVGDGVNDAPALTAATIGISMASATDLSVQVSDLFLTTHNFMHIAHIRSLAQRATKIIAQNIFWAFFYNIIGVLLAVLGVFPPIIAALAMVLSSFFVIFNAKRL